LITKKRLNENRITTYGGKEKIFKDEKKEN
jgi:hypothetical protein